MKKKLFFFSLMLSAFGAYAQAQNLYSTSIDWSERPELHNIPEKYRDESAVYLEDKRIIEFNTDGKVPLQYSRCYSLIKVNDDKGIEQFNRIYIPVPANGEVTDIKARVITSAGFVVTIPESKVKEETEEGRTYKIFAMEGIDRGSEIEYTYKTKRSMNLFGTEIFQSKLFPYLHAQITVISPSNLKFNALGFNGFHAMPDTLIGEQRFIAGYSSDVSAMNDEKYSLPDHYLQRFEYKLAYNLSRSAAVEMYSWKELAKNVYTALVTYSSKELSAVNKFIGAAKIPDNAGEEETIRLLEDYLKTKINTDENYSAEDAEDIEKIVKTGNSNNFGTNRFFAAMLENKGIKYQPVFASVRNGLPLSEDLANWNRADDMIFYFPATGKFLQPTEATSRYPYTDPYYAGTKGLFLKGTSIGDLKTAVAKFDTIPMVPFEESASNMDIRVKTNNSMDSLIIDSKQILKGYSAQNYRPIWAYLTKDKIDETVNGIVSSIAKNNRIEKVSAENTAFSDSWTNKPLIISSLIRTGDLLEKAGNNYLFKVGELIGAQEEMYQEKPRQLPVELSYPHVLQRRISFEVPAGYIIRNPDDINKTIEYKDNSGTTTMGFVSSYTLKGNQLEISIMETYRLLNYPLASFEDFKKVINASADFNKVTLILEKK